MNYILLELDTTPPILEIYAPNYTTRSALTPITIQSNELLSSYQEVYIVDSEGERRDLTFAHEGSALVGSLYLNGYSVGIATLYVRLKDEVDNISALYSFSFNIIESEILTSEMSLYRMDNQLSLSEMSNQLSVNGMDNQLNINEMDNTLLINTMKNEMAVVS